MHLVLRLLLALLLAAAVYATTWGPPIVHPPTTQYHGAFRTGDMLLCRTGAADFRLSTAFTGAHYSHVGIILATESTPLGVPLVLESHCHPHTPYPDLVTGIARQGWQLHVLSRRVQEYDDLHHGWSVVRRLRGGPPLPPLLELLASPRRGRFPGGADMLLSAGLRSLRDRWGGERCEAGAALERRPDELCCSAFVALWYRTSGVMRPQLPLTAVYPHMFVKDDSRLGLQPPFRFDPPALLA
jgi:hypothetical protein